MRFRIRVGPIAAISFLGIALTLATCTRASTTSTVAQGASHVLYADTVLQEAKAIQDLQVTVQASATFDNATGKYTYTYTITNETSSTGDLHTFGLGPLPALTALESPPHWDGGLGWEGDSTLAGWTVVDNDTTALPPTDTGNIYPSPFDLQPGHTLTGFTVISYKPPTTIQFYAQAFDTLPAGDDDVGPPALSEEGVTGSILGPDRTYVVAVPEGGGTHGVKFRPPAPNPTRGAVLLVFELPGPSSVVADVIDIGGGRVRSLIHAPMSLGLHTVTWSGLDEGGRRVPPGVYFFRLSVNGGVAERRRVVILR